MVQGCPWKTISGNQQQEPLWERPIVSRSGHGESPATPSTCLRLTMSETSCLFDFLVLWANKCFLLLKWMWVTFCHVQPRKSWTVQGLSSLHVFRTQNMIPQEWGLGMLSPLNWRLERLQKQDLCDLLPPVSCPQPSSSWMNHRNQSFSSPWQITEMRDVSLLKLAINSKRSHYSFPSHFSLEDLHYRGPMCKKNNVTKKDSNPTHRTIGRWGKLGVGWCPSPRKSSPAGWPVPMINSKIIHKSIMMHIDQVMFRNMCVYLYACNNN